MTRLAWFPEPFHAYGAFAGEGTRRILGKPRLDPLTVLIRETVQNSWDARRHDGEAVEFAVDGWTLLDDQLVALRHDVFTGMPSEGLHLGEVLDWEDVPVVCISDRGTVGLTGPVRADLPVTGRSDFTDYVFNMGQPRNVPGGGGTYGFGKTITYVVSQAATVVIYTRTRVETELESRLIGVAVGAQYSTDELRYTGRHWWGVRRDERIEPLTGSETDELAARLGFPTFEGDATGLSLLVIAPDFRERSPEQAMNFVANALVWNFWPKMIGVRQEDDPPMRFRVSWNGRDVPVPRPEEYPPLGAYVRAYRAIHAYENEEDVDPDISVTPIRAQRPNRQLGLLAVTRATRLPRGLLDEGAEPDGDPGTAAAFEGNSHHVALMRRVELIVKYLPGLELPLPQVEWAGVFINEEDIDQAFAAAEPPTHDDWEPTMVDDKRQRRLVNLALRYIESGVRQMFGPAPATVVDGGQPSAVVVGNALGGLIASAVGIGAGKQPAVGGVEGGGGGRRGGARRRRAVIADMSARLVMSQGVPATEVEFRVETAGVETPVRIVASAGAAIDGAAPERDPPLGAATPVVEGWRRSTESAISVRGHELTIDPADTGPWVLLVRNPLGAAVAVDVSVAPETAET